MIKHISGTIKVYLENKKGKPVVAFWKKKDLVYARTDTKGVKVVATRGRIGYIKTSLKRFLDSNSDIMSRINRSVVVMTLRMKSLETEYGILTLRCTDDRFEIQTGCLPTVLKQLKSK